MSESWDLAIAASVTLSGAVTASYVSYRQAMKRTKEEIEGLRAEVDELKKGKKREPRSTRR